MKRTTTALGAAFALALLASPAAALTHQTTLPNGASLSVGVTSPTDGETFLIQPPATSIDVSLSGTAEVGTGQPDALWIYVIDVSTSTMGPCSSTNILGCEKQAALNLNAEVVASNSASEVGAAIFAGDSATADMTNAGGEALTTAPSDTGVTTVVNSINFLGIGQFTAKSVPDLTNFASGLSAANTIANSTSAGNVNVVFMSDGASNTGGGGFDAALNSLVTSGAKIFPFAVGGGADCNVGSAGTLQQMANATGTACTNVPDPADLPDIVVDLVSTELTSVAVTVDGTPISPVSIIPTVPVTGPVTSDWTATAADQTPGTHEVCATATGAGPVSDPDATGTVEECVSFDVYGFDLTPVEATNELGTDNTHTVTATVLGEPGKLGGWPVDFSVSAGPNAGATGTCAPAACATGADGTVTFTYTVPQAPASLGTDTVSAEVAINSDTASLSATKDWVDTTPPTATCTPSVNPAGKIPAAPGKGGQHQNPDGFYQMSAIDDIWPATDLEVFVKDSGSDAVFGPFAVGDDFKYVQAPGAEPSQSAGTGEVEWMLKGKGDAQVYAVDGSGNESAAVSCTVPPRD